MRKFLWLRTERNERLLPLTFLFIEESYEVKIRILLIRMKLISKGRRWHRDLRVYFIF